MKSQEERTERIIFLADAYKKKGIDVGFITVIEGPKGGT